MKITEKEFNALTGETTFTERDETAQEQTVREAAEAEFAAFKAEAEAKAQAKATAEGKLAALGLTTDDLRALGL
jgi:regulator of protease activity HflC (stomatin/prohibitin superfamily)